jgi:hypothetical protein
MSAAWDSRTAGLPGEGTIDALRLAPLADADHLLSRKRDATYVGNVVAAWAERYLVPAASAQ